MSMMNREPRFVFWFCGDVNPQLTTRFKQYLYKCQVEKTDAVAMVSGSGGHIYCVSDIWSTLEATKVHLTTIGFGEVSNIMAALFCLGDERVLMNGTSVVFNDIEENLTAACCYKTLLTDELWKDKVLSTPHKSWEVKEREWRKYGVTTALYSKLFKRLVAIYKGERNSDFDARFFFNKQFDCMSAVEFIKHIYKCASLEKDVLVEISSPGGSGCYLLAIIDTLRCSKVKLTIIGGGHVASCAAILFLQGDVRALKCRTRFLLHNGSWTPQKEFPLLAMELDEKTKDLIAGDKKMKKLILAKTQIPEQEFDEKVKGKDWVVEEEKWKEYGIVTNTYEEVLETFLNS